MGLHFLDWLMAVEDVKETLKKSFDFLHESELRVKVIQIACEAIDVSAETMICLAKAREKVADVQRDTQKRALLDAIVIAEHRVVRQALLALYSLQSDAIQKFVELVPDGVPLKNFSDFLRERRNDIWKKALEVIEDGVWLEKLLEHDSFTKDLRMM